MDFIKRCLQITNSNAESNGAAIGSAIIYCRARSDCEGMTNVMKLAGLNAAAYHAGLPDKVGFFLLAINSKFLRLKMHFFFRIFTSYLDSLFPLVLLLQSCPEVPHINFELPCLSYNPSLDSQRSAAEMDERRDSSRRGHDRVRNGH